MDDDSDNRTEGIGPAIDAQTELMRSLADESQSHVDRLRSAQIPQHVGMAAAGRALATDVPRMLMAQVQTEIGSGALGQRWEAALARAGKDGPEATLAALAVLLIDQARVTGRYLATRAEEWAADAYRLEGQATALEAQTKRLAEARDGIARSRAAAEAQGTVQERRREQRLNGEAPSLRPVPASAEASEG